MITPTGRSRATFLEMPDLVDDVDDMIDVLVRGRLFFGQALVAAGARDDADRVQLLVDPPAGGQLDRRGAAHLSAGAVAGRAERACPCCRAVRPGPNWPSPCSPE